MPGLRAFRVGLNAYPGSDFAEIYPKARSYYNKISASTRRQPYVRCVYFGKQKVFLELFWVHLNQKNRKERNRRLKNDELFFVQVKFNRRTGRRDLMSIFPA